MANKDVIRSHVLEGEYQREEESRGQERDRKASQAWEFIKRDGSWRVWLRVADGLDFLRTEAMAQSGSNRPYGRGYQYAWAELAKSRPYASEMDNRTKADCLWCIDHLPEISEWRETLDVNKRAKFNHPSTVRRQFEKTVNETEKKEQFEAKPGSLIEQLRATIHELEADNARLVGKIMELEMLIVELKAEIAVLKTENATLKSGGAARN
jgi:hypothetical protein